jgi:hypothetical protein
MLPLVLRMDFLLIWGDFVVLAFLGGSSKSFFCYFRIEKHHVIMNAKQQQ